MTHCNDPAHPARINDCELYGLTKREWFAGLAMQGRLANPDDSELTVEQTAELAVEIADAILAELSK